MKEFQSYYFVGSKEIKSRVEKRFEGKRINRKEDIRNWIKESGQNLRDDEIVATFVIKESEELVISDRHSEHVLCAGGKDVLSAGEITFRVEKGKISVIEITNQSTGYCPKPNSWGIVEIAIARIGIEHPEYFTKAYDFRYCENCETKNLIKEEIYECAVCGSELELEWNIDKIKV